MKRLLLFCLGVCLSLLPLHVSQAAWRAGTAAVNITPGYPVRLSGYGSRTTEHEGVKADLWAKVLVLAWDNEPPAVVVTVDNVGVPDTLRAEVLALVKDTGLVHERFALCSTHTHCAPVLRGSLRNIFGTDLPPDQQQRVDRYTNELRDWLAKGIHEAVAGMQPATLEWSRGEALFAANRRYKTATGFSNSPNPEGPVDHDLPVMTARNQAGEIFAVLTSYACHCTTMGWNFVHPDWAGIAQVELQKRYPKAVALTAIGCGADQNPYPRREEALVLAHGQSLAKAAEAAINAGHKPLNGPLTCATREVQLAFATPPTEEELKAKTESKSAHERYHGSFYLSMLKRREAIPTAMPYTVQAWTFGDGLAMVFLNGEVVVDYGLRLKREFDRERLWVNSYSNNVPCYIPSERVLEEGGYEGAGAMLYYLQPTKFAPGLEAKIIGAVHEMLPAGFKASAPAPAAPAAAPPPAPR